LLRHNKYPYHNCFLGKLEFQFLAFEYLKIHFWRLIFLDLLKGDLKRSFKLIEL
jgi:hypothetical protein